MARSGSYNYNISRNDLITLAFRETNIYSKNEDIRSDDMNFAIARLNIMIKFWQAQGLALWNRKQATLFPAYQDRQYSISNTGDHCANSYVSSTLSADEALGQTVLSVTSTTGMTAADNVGIELDDSSRQWTTIVSVDSSTQITVTATLTAAAASGNTIIAYTNKIADRPLRILNARSVDLKNSNTAVKMNTIGHDEYFNLPTKDLDGNPNSYFYDKQLDAGILYLFPRPNKVSQLIEFTYHESFEDMDSSTDDFDFPAEWFEVLLTNLKLKLAGSYGMEAIIPRLQQEAAESLALAQFFDADEESIKFNL